MQALVPDAGEAMTAGVDLLRAQVAIGEHRIDDARIHARSALEIADRLGDKDMRCESLELLGRAERVSDLVTAERHFTEAMLTAEAAGLELRRVRALHELGTIDLVRLARRIVCGRPGTAPSPSAPPAWPPSRACTWP